MALDLPAADAVVAVLPIGDGTCNEPIAALVAAVEPGRSAAGAGQVVGKAAGVLAALWRLERQVQASGAQVADLRALASTDPLTGLANRRALSMRLTAEEQRCCRSGLSAGILVLDVDDLKGSNDRLGHAAGDEILCHVAAALRRVTRAGDLIARTGGDEFVALMVDLPVGGLADVKERIERELTTASVSASVGWAERSAGGGLEAAWHVADLEMYHQKLSRRSVNSPSCVGWPVHGYLY